ncbi:TetR/AcrR family transcriptional regulator [Granulicella sibirica]|uniref:Transcriptional regulator, TetR family n=1 Tax=Granulicella sibirica TaxID=2479048 RepID=A0A4Q0T1Z7_9BACT|nr:TetR/AcrR family transcriptional regulator [Granulicella sibirica]RXH57613.1 Transcriptional regulator, TetR family [Granulicella sibirica]
MKKKSQGNVDLKKSAVKKSAVKKSAVKKSAVKEPDETAPRLMRADARRKMDSLVQAATEVFATSGVDAPVREIADKAGVGLGTMYRHFPRRSDLIAAVMQTQVDACADAASTLAKKYEPGDALARWLYRLMDFFGTKRGLAAALHSGDPAYSTLPGYFLRRINAALAELIDAAVAAKVVRPGVNPEDLLWAVAALCHGRDGKEPAYARKMVDLLVDGLRFGASKPTRHR